jgi:DNA-binding response OmpR family regulator
MPKEIVVSDDNATIVHQIQHALEAEGYAVRTGFTGEEVISLVTDWMPNLLVLGHELADGDGFRVLESLHSRSVTPALPVMMVTGHIEKEDVIRGWKFGVIDYNSKRGDALPNLIPEMIIKIGRIFKSIEDL